MTKFDRENEDVIDLGDAAEETRGGVQPTHQELDGFSRIALIDA